MEVGAPVGWLHAQRDEQARCPRCIVVLLVAAFAVVGQRALTAEQDNFGALQTSDWQPKVAAGVLAR
jgi:hypothetical protein